MIFCLTSTDIYKAELSIVYALAEFQRRFRGCRHIEGVIDLVVASQSGSRTLIEQLPRISDISVADLQLKYYVIPPQTQQPNSSYLKWYCHIDVPQ